MTTSIGPATGRNVRWGDIAVFLAIAFGSTWTLSLSGYFGVPIPQDVLEPASMVCVALATFITMRWRVRPGSITMATALKPWRLNRYALLGAGLPLAVLALSLLLGWLSGSFVPDLANLSGLRLSLAPTTVGEQGFPTALALQALATALVLFIVTLPLMFAEEWGWRGFLLPRLLRWGLWPALVASSLIWAVWHLPLYFSPFGRDTATLPPFLIAATLMGIAFGWLRLRSKSVWPCVIAHGVNNVIVGVVGGMVADADYLGRGDLAYHFGLSGWPGWVAYLLAIVVLFRIANLRGETAHTISFIAESDRAEDKRPVAFG